MDFLTREDTFPLLPAKEPSQCGVRKPPGHGIVRLGTRSLQFSSSGGGWPPQQSLSLLYFDIVLLSKEQSKGILSK